MENIYKTTAVSTGGRDGKVDVENSPLQFDMALPPELGGMKESGANPEQLFAAGYSTCFGSAMQHAMRSQHVHTSVPVIHLTVGIGKAEAGGYQLSVEIVAVFKGIDQTTADSLMKEAHDVCPYSRATRGNIEVTLKTILE